MSVRYWAPSQPRIGPGPVDLALIEPTGDARMDLGAALLGMHRVGAAACKAAATTPLLSESTLVKSLAAAREALADSMINSVSKSTSGTNYAALLVRDLFDDAESSALDLFRAAVAKGVAPTLAADRVGAVYGVPAAELGKYRALAADPRVNPAALADTADRVLLSYVEKVVGEEVADSVSKQTATQERPALSFAIDPDDPHTPYYDARDARGRFARTEGAATRRPVATQSGGAGARARTATLPTAAEPAPTARPMSPLMATLRRRMGVGRQQAPDVVGITPEEAAATELAAAEQQRQREQQEYREWQQWQSQAAPKAPTKGKPVPVVTPLQAVQAEAQQVIIPAAAAAKLEATKPKTPPGPPKRNLLSWTPDPEHYEEEPGNVFSFVMPAENFRAFQRDQGGSPDQMFRAHHLIADAGGEGLRSEPAEEAGGENIEAMIGGLTAGYGAKGKGGGHTAIHLSKEELEMAVQDGRARGLRHEAAIKEYENEMLEYNEVTREDLIRLPDRSGDGVWFVDPDFSDVPTVIDYRLINPRVTFAGADRGAGLKIDKNQAWKPADMVEVKRRIEQEGQHLQGMPTAGMYWQEEPDTGTQAVHFVYFFVPAEEHEVQQAELAAEARRRARGTNGEEGEEGTANKALVTVADRAELARRSEIQPRDEHGRWAKTGAPRRGISTTRLLGRQPVAVPAAAVPEPDEQRAREQREAREFQEWQTLVQPQQKKPVAVPKRELSAVPISARNIQLSERGAQKLQATRLQANKPKDDLPSLPSLDLEDGYYQAHSLDWFETFVEPGKDVRFTGPHARQLMEMGMFTGEEAQRELAFAYLRQQIRQDDQQQAPNALTWTEGEIPEDWPEYEARSMLQSPEVGYLQDPSQDPDRTERRMNMNLTGPVPVVLIEFDEDIDPGQPMKLVFQGESTNYYYLKAEDNELQKELPGDVRMNFPVLRYLAVPDDAGPNAGGKR